VIPASQCSPPASKDSGVAGVKVLELWRYPVKSMAGERLDESELTASGLAGDRVLQVRNPSGKILTARTKPLLLRHHAVTTADGGILIDGRPWDAEEVARDVQAAAGPQARLVRSDAEDRFDILPLLIATDGMLRDVGYDRRRFRPNVVIGDVEGLAEREWEGRELRIGGVRIGLADLRGRCVMTTYDPDTGAQDLNVLRKVQREFGGKLGLNAYVIAPGRIRVGDPVELAAAA